jgi:dTDP-4-dehydrorhamnose reductase
MKHRILLTGKNGQVGAELAALLPHLAEVTAFNRHQLDLSKPDQIRGAIRNIRPHVIVNAAAYTFVDQAESQESEAGIINADAPAIMAEEAKNIGAVLVHYSTDYIFDGSKSRPYDETDRPNPINVYGKTKLAAEQAIQDAGLPYLIFRTAWVYGRRGRNFLLTILRLATEREELRIVNDQFGAPTWSREIAKASARILTQLFEQGQEIFSRSSGIYHMTATCKTNWCEFGKAILEEACRISPNVSWFAAATGGRPLVAGLVTPVTTEEYPTLARRPTYSVLSNSRLKCIFDSELSHWRTELHSAFAASPVKDQSND